MTATLLTNGTIVTLDAGRRIIVDGAVAIEAGRITAVGKRAALEPRFEGALRIDAAGGYVLPGFVDAHVHLAETILRGAAVDLPLRRFLTERLFPLEKAASAEDEIVSAELTLMEMLRSGTTCFAESLLPATEAIDGIAQAVLASRMRGLLCLTASAQDGGDNFATIAAAHERWHGAGGRLALGLALRTYTGGDPTLLRSAGAKARAARMQVSWHFTGSAQAVKTIAETHGKSPAAFADDLGLLWPGQILGHCIGLGPEDLAILKRTGAKIVHLPLTNLRLAMGFAPIPEMLAAGIDVALGTDGDNAHDMFQPMLLAATLHKGRSLDATAVPVETAIEMATINGAKALGLEAEIGSIEIGKKADLIVVDAGRSFLTPKVNPLASLVFGASGRDVTIVLIEGEVVVRDGRVLTLDEPRILREAESRAGALIARAGLADAVRPRWPVS